MHVRLTEAAHNTHTTNSRTCDDKVPPVRSTLYLWTAKHFRRWCNRWCNNPIIQNVHSDFGLLRSRPEWMRQVLMNSANSDFRLNYVVLTIQYCCITLLLNSTNL